MVDKAVPSLDVVETLNTSPLSRVTVKNSPLASLSISAMADSPSGNLSFTIAASAVPADSAPAESPVTNLTTSPYRPVALLLLSCSPTLMLVGAFSSNPFVKPAFCDICASIARRAASSALAFNFFPFSEVKSGTSLPDPSGSGIIRIISGLAAATAGS